MLRLGVALTAGALLAASPALAQAPGGAAARSAAGIQARDVRLFTEWLTGSFSNREQVYFTAEVEPKAKPVPHLRWEVAAVADQPGRLTAFAFDAGKPDSPPVRTETLTITADASGQGVRLTTGPACTIRYVRMAAQFVAADGLRDCKTVPEPFWAIGSDGLFTGRDGTITAEFRRVRGFTCWAAIPKVARRADGSTDWWGGFGLKVHDQGGRIWFQTDEPTPQRFGIELRNVVWPYGNNRPSLTLYVYTPEDERRAVAYSWADPQAERIGLNTRAVQVSCTRDGSTR